MDLLPFIREAIDALGYVRPEGAATLAQALALGQGRHVRDIAAALRKAEPQLSTEEKGKAGLRPEVSLSWAVWEMLTAKGRKRPIEALETTLLRATFTQQRESKIAFAEQRAGHFLKTFGLVPGCEGCVEYNRREMTPEQARKALPPKTCAREACGISLLVWQDFPVIDPDPL